jgi:hypothetical protein
LFCQSPHFNGKSSTFQSNAFLNNHFKPRRYF